MCQMHRLNFEHNSIQHKVCSILECVPSSQRTVQVVGKLSYMSLGAQHPVQYARIQ